MSVLKRNERIDVLVKASYNLLAFVQAKNGSVKAKEGRDYATSLVNNQSRRDSVWATVVNIGFLAPVGKGNYQLTDAGKNFIHYWKRKLT